ncbi:MAG: hypothetical protein A2927_00710 [Candidatus Komeilibacteria bacterium RIFCSPLOWO2_01_FULL_45_10]|uniref:FtsK domain-containing protein n=1 Tax=Candidatus Komeilibacteria bacterium RIFCSPLOWO2_01_FULL_45_10 TaxID=1798550 RepID=A0A1G2BKJ6_9BACT|nr:MAG: hypothetical protein A2927_00710 [Candidatus Komeilibacteria bacterium RIFCSPLOWO2_01_FULL_45_10]
MRKKHYRRRGEREATEEEADERGVLNPETKKSILIIILFVAALLALLSFFDLAGGLGILFKKGLMAFLGWGAFAFPIVLLLLGYFLLFPEKYRVKPSNYLGLVFWLLGLTGILQFIKDVGETAAVLSAESGGGYLGFFIYAPLQKIMGSAAALIVLIAIFFISLIIAFNATLNQILRKINVFRLFRPAAPEDEAETKDWETSEEGWAEEEVFQEGEETPRADKAAETEIMAAGFTKKRVAELGVKKSTRELPAGLKVTFSNNGRRKIEVPFSLLEGRSTKPTSGDIKANQEIIRQTLENFGIPVEMGDVNVGPTVTQFTFKPSEGIKLSRITALQNDLALALAAHPIRLEAPIPGKSLVGVEVPNQHIAVVKLKDILESDDFKKKKGRLKIGLGEDVAGRCWAVDLAGMPHLLIAGATGSGKSVCINNIIISLLYQCSPDELRLIIIDPKRVELTNYNGIPHLLTPVITEVDKTINALRWLVREMDERFRLLNSTGKRNIESYNAGVLANRLPYIVIIIDELADLMATAARDVEGAIVRLAQMARAVGIHLAVATQRPSVNVITGLIKANITSRIAFAVASQVDSRTILDFSGAEKLLGKGDLLFTSAEISKPRRIQGAYLTDAEIERVIDFWKQQREPDYNEEVTEKSGQMAMGGLSTSDDGDELLGEAKNIILKAGKASASLLQRRLRVGYARAARLLDLLEEQGVIGPGDGAKPREVLMTEDEIYNIPAETTERYNDESDESDELSDEEETAIEDDNEKTEEAEMTDDENDEEK